MQAIAAELDRPVKMVRWKIKQLGLPTFDARTLNPGAHRTVWTEERLSYLKSHATTSLAKDVAAHLGVTERAVRAAMLDRKIPGRGQGAPKPEASLQSVRDKARVRREATYPPAGPWVCVACKQSRPLTDFNLSKTERQDHVCRACARSHWIHHAYGISAEQYDAMLAAQDGVCAICRHPEKRLRADGVLFSLAVDHDHSCCPGKKTCGKCLRGLLCWECNNVLGKVEAREGMIAGIVSYLK